MQFSLDEEGSFALPCRWYSEPYPVSIAGVSSARCRRIPLRRRHVKTSTAVTMATTGIVTPMATLAPVDSPRVESSSRGKLEAFEFPAVPWVLVGTETGVGIETVVGVGTGVGVPFKRQY